MLNLEKMWKCAKTEAEWLKYYGHVDSRMSEDFSDVNFYDRIKSIGYTKRVISIDRRCSMMNITADKPVLECEINELRIGDGPRDHSKNVYTALEWFISKGVGTEQLIEIIKK